MLNKIIICFFAAIGSTIGIFITRDLNLIPAMVMCVCALVLCLLWFSDLTHRIKAQSDRRSRSRKAPEEWFSIDIPLDEDKPTDKTNTTGMLRPGSVQSEAYIRMKQEQEAAS